MGLLNMITEFKKGDRTFRVGNKYGIYDRSDGRMFIKDVGTLENIGNKVFWFFEVQGITGIPYLLLEKDLNDLIDIETTVTEIKKEASKLNEMLEYLKVTDIKEI